MYDQWSLGILPPSKLGYAETHPPPKPIMMYNVNINRVHLRKEDPVGWSLTRITDRILAVCCCLPEIDESVIEYADEMMDNCGDIAEEQLADPVSVVQANVSMMKNEEENGLASVQDEQSVDEDPSSPCVQLVSFVPRLATHTVIGTVVDDSLDASSDGDDEGHVINDIVTDLESGPWEHRSSSAKHVLLRSKSSVVENTRAIHKRGGYTRAVVHECKTRFGRPERTAANVLAVRRYALDIMTRHGLRPTHIQQQLPMVVELVFVRSAAEHEAEYLTETLRYADRHGGRFSWFRRTYHYLVGVSPTRKWY